MAARHGPMAIIRERAQWVAYGFIAGITLGLILGWLFHGVVSMVLRFGLVIALLLPLALVFIGWRRYADRRQADQRLVRAAADERRVIDVEPLDGDQYVVEARGKRSAR